MSEDVEPRVNRPGLLARLALVWFVWLIGPAGLVTWVSHYGCLHPFEQPSAGVGTALITTQITSAIATCALVVRPGVRRLGEFWLLVGYWLCVGGFLTSIVLQATASITAFAVAAVFVAFAVPVGSLLRLLSWILRESGTAEHPSGPRRR